MPPKKPAAGKSAAKPAAKPASKTAAGKSQPKKAEAAAAAPPPPAVVAEPVYIELLLKQFAGVVFDNVDSRITDTGKWPLIADTTDVVGTFIRHRDCNFLHAADPNEMQPERIRIALLGSLRFGKPFVVNMLDANLVEPLKKFFNAVEPNLWDNLMSKKILEEDVYEKLIKDTDDPQYQANNFSPLYMEKFVFCILTTLQTPPAELLTAMCPVRISK